MKHIISYRSTQLDELQEYDMHDVRILSSFLDQRLKNTASHCGEDLTDYLSIPDVVMVPKVSSLYKVVQDNLVEAIVSTGNQI